MEGAGRGSGRGERRAYVIILPSLPGQSRPPPLRPQPGCPPWAWGPARQEGGVGGGGARGEYKLAAGPTSSQRLEQRKSIRRTRAGAGGRPGSELSCGEGATPFRGAYGARKQGEVWGLLAGAEQQYHALKRTPKGSRGRGVTSCGQLGQGAPGPKTFLSRYKGTDGPGG